MINLFSVEVPTPGSSAASLRMRPHRAPRPGGKCPAVSVLQSGSFVAINFVKAVASKRERATSQVFEKIAPEDIKLHLNTTKNI